MFAARRERRITCINMIMQPNHREQKKNTHPEGTTATLPLIHRVAIVAYPEVPTWYIHFTLQLLQHAAGLI